MMIPDSGLLFLATLYIESDSP